MGSLLPNFEGLLGAILTGGSHCKCRAEHNCLYTGREWCYRLVAKDNAHSLVQLPQPDAQRCLYGDRPGCCWVLAEVETLAREYLVKTGAHGPPVPSEVIDVFDEGRKTEVRLVPLRALHGATWLLGREWVIQLNARDSNRARRYTMFHEAFHITYRIACPAFKETEPSHKSFNEVLADHFATCLLMPRDWIEECWPRVQDVRTMADIFDVPIRQMTRRLNQLRLLQKASDYSKGRRSWNTKT